MLAVETAEEGMEKLKRQHYDVIIVDYRLPGMDGLEFLDRIKDSHPNALTLLITAYGSGEVFSKASSLGVQGFIDKPFTVKTFEEALSRLIEKNEKQER
ncbi:MAG: response regulator [Deltaproteobacteria bacterium]